MKLKLRYRLCLDPAVAGEQPLLRGPRHMGSEADGDRGTGCRASAWPADERIGLRPARNRDAALGRRSVVRPGLPGCAAGDEEDDPGDTGRCRHNQGGADRAVDQAKRAADHVRLARRCGPPGTPTRGARRCGAPGVLVRESGAEEPGATPRRLASDSAALVRAGRLSILARAAGAGRSSGCSGPRRTPVCFRRFEVLAKVPPLEPHKPFVFPCL
jgi:hypothetical protein